MRGGVGWGVGWRNGGLVVGWGVGGGDQGVRRVRRGDDVVPGEDLWLRLELASCSLACL